MQREQLWHEPALVLRTDQCCFLQTLRRNWKLLNPSSCRPFPGIVEQFWGAVNDSGLMLPQIAKKSELSLGDVSVFSSSCWELVCAGRAFPRTVSVHPEWPGPAEMWCWLLELWGSLFSWPPWGDGLRKTGPRWQSWNKKVGKRRGCEGYWSNGSDWGGIKMKVRIKRSWKNTWIKVSLQGWQDRWGYKEVIDGCKSFGSSSADAEDVRKEQRKTKSSCGNGENIPDFWVQKRATPAGGRMRSICLLQQISWPNLLGFGH